MQYEIAEKKLKFLLRYFSKEVPLNVLLSICLLWGEKGRGGSGAPAPILPTPVTGAQKAAEFCDR